MIKFITAMRIYAVFLIWDTIGTIWNCASIGDYYIELKHKKFWAYRINKVKFAQRPNVWDILGVL